MQLLHIIMGGAMSEFWFNFEPVGTTMGFITKFHGSEEVNFELTDTQLNMVIAFMDSQQLALQKFLQGIVE